VLRVGSPGIEPAAAKRLARRVVSQHLAGNWQVVPLGEGSRDFLIRRRPPEPNPPVSQAFDLAYRLRPLRDVEDCEPSLYLPVEGPEQVRVEREDLGGRATSSDVRRRPVYGSSGGGGADLSCSTDVDWPLRMCRVPQGWALGGDRRPSMGQEIRIGHPDTGYSEHPQLWDRARLLTGLGFDFERGAADPRDPLTGLSGGHGTSTGSVIISGIEPEPQVTGAAPRASLVPLRVTSSVVLLSFGRLAEAIRYAADRGFHVVSISLGGPIYSRFLQRAVEHAVSQGLIVIAAAGNVWPFVVYPARLDEVIAVAACNCRGEVWSDSAFGSAVDITAPGESVWRAVAAAAGHSVARGSGTSFATAITAGVAAMWLSHHGRERLIRRYGLANLAAVFKWQLLHRGFQRPPGWDTTRYGVGILDAQRLLSAPLPETAPAGGVRGLSASVAPRSRSQFDEIAQLLPGQRPSALQVKLAAMLRVDEPRLPAALRDVGEEIAYRAVTDMPFRQSLLSAQPARANAARAARPAARSASAVVLPARMSRRLRQMTT
jgi:thermitase